jgi:hypothetical protein
MTSCLVPDPATADGGSVVFATQSGSAGCNTNGDVILPYGSPQYLGLGLVVFVALVSLSSLAPAMKNTQVPTAARIVLESALLVGTSWVGIGGVNGSLCHVAFLFWSSSSLGSLAACHEEHPEYDS